MLKQPLQIFARHQKGDMIHLLRHTASTKIGLTVRPCRSVSASTTGIQVPTRKGRCLRDRWHVFTLQEASEYVNHDILTCRFHVTHDGGCAILFNKDTFYPNIDVKSIYLHDTRRDLPDQVMEGGQGWVMQGVLSRASFRCPPLSGQKSFTVLSLHISSIYAKKRGIAKKQLIFTVRAIMIGLQNDVVASDFNGTAWRCSSRDNISTIDEAFEDCALPTPPGPTPLWGPGSIPNKCADVCGFLKPPGSHRFWKVRMPGAFSIPCKTPGLRPTDQSCHHETWLHLDYVDWCSTQSHHDEDDRRIFLKERPTACPCGQQKRTYQRSHERPLALFIERATICTCIMRRFAHPHEQACFREACFSSILSFHVPFVSALKIHRALKPSRTPRHGVKKKREGVVISAAESMSKRGQRNGISVSLKSHRKSFSEESQRILL